MPNDPKPLTLKEISTAARNLANILFSNEETRCTQKVRCMEREENRFLTALEKKRGWTRRPFNAYDPEQMCNGCRAYWFQEMAAQALHDCYVWAETIKAEAKK